MSAVRTARNAASSGMGGSSGTLYDDRMARIALAMGPGGHPADLGPCARPRIDEGAVRSALTTAGHILVDDDPDLTVADVVVGEPPPAGRLVLVSFDRPVDPWHAIADAGDRQAFIEPWGADLADRKRAALPRRADAFADTIEDLAVAVEVALSIARPEPPALRYLGALFNSCSLRPGTSFELDIEPRPLVLGRGQTADVHVPSPQLARAHLQLAVAEGDIEVTDLGSTNGTWLYMPYDELVALVPGAPLPAPPGALVIPDGSFRFLVA